MPPPALHNMTGMMDRMGMKGDRFLVNGREQPYVRVPARWARLRLLNGSNARVYNLAFADRRAFHVVATDAGLLAWPVEVRSPDAAQRLGRGGAGPEHHADGRRPLRLRGLRPDAIARGGAQRACGRAARMAGRNPRAPARRPGAPLQPAGHDGRHDGGRRHGGGVDDGRHGRWAGRARGLRPRWHEPGNRWTEAVFRRPPVHEHGADQPVGAPGQHRGLGSEQRREHGPPFPLPRHLVPTPRPQRRRAARA
ncbi:hypothetical protein THIX_60148 [Thiomonas sp. X19]|nr:hypothetical protein THIX_60148 [Thiomonas sp. X19]